VKEVLVCDRERRRIAAALPERGPNLGEILIDLRGQRRGTRDPAVGLDDSVEHARRHDGRLGRGGVRHLSTARGPYRQTPCHRRADLHVAHTRETPLVGDHFTREQSPHQFDGFVGARAAFGLLDADGFELPLVPARPHTQDESFV
jgi:hypothetical protein